MSKERTRFVLEWERRWNEGEGTVNVSALCRQFGVSRECGHKWVKRYVEAGRDLIALQERSRRPHRSPTETEQEIQDLIVAARKARPKWGPLKLRGWLTDRYSNIPFPSPSAIAALLKRRGLVRPAKRRRPAVLAKGVKAPFQDCDAPNRVWCVDFKGWFRTKDGEKCQPLTLTDAFSRYLLRCEAVAEPDGKHVQAVFDSAFLEFGLPDAIRSDNGPPFASSGPSGLSRLSVWWLELGLRVEHIAPGKPQQNGRHERMHRTLALEVEQQADLRAQQRALDLWRRDFNEERPHAALGNVPPARVYQPSGRSYPRPYVKIEPSPWTHLVRVDDQGYIRFLRRRVFISTALKHVDLELWDADLEGIVYDVKWGDIFLGRIRTDALDRGIAPARRKRGEVSAMSLK